MKYVHSYLYVDDNFFGAMKKLNNLLLERLLAILMMHKYYISFFVHFAPFGGRKCVLEWPLCGA